jgi:hypothetical protein
MTGSNEVREEVRRLLDNLGTIGTFMLGEMRVFLRRSWGASREEFFAALDQVTRTMKESGKWAVDDIQRAAEQIKKNWALLDRERSLDWDEFLADIKTRLKTVGEITQDTFNRTVEQAGKALDKQWEKTGRIGEEQVEVLKKHSEEMAKVFKAQWGVFWGTMEKTGKKIDRAVNAAWEELKKKD